MDPKQDNFDWVAARKQCSLVSKFEDLKEQAEKNAISVGFRFESNGNRFMVFSESSTQRVRFTLLPEECISVKETGGSKPKHYRITLTLNHDGECCYKFLEGDKEYKCWQVLRRVLEPLFFDSPSSVIGKRREKGDSGMTI